MVKWFIIFASVSLTLFLLITLFFGKTASWIRRIYRSVFKIKPFSDIIVDDLGVPIKFYRDIAGPQRNPVTVCDFALKYYEEGDEKSFLNCANWLVDNLSPKEAFSVWKYKFPWQIYNLAPPWVSGMAQGLGIKVLVLAHKITSDDRFINAAREALNAFTTPIEKGGVLQIDESDGGWWYEEYASPDSIRSYVLNGHVFALEGIYEFYMHTKDSIALRIFNKGLNELKNHLHEYDTGSWTCYDRLGHIAGWEYHELHVRQTLSLWERGRDEFFLKYHHKWKEYMTKASSKIRYKYGMKLTLATLISMLIASTLMTIILSQII